MKIFVTILVATTLALVNADVGLKQGYSYNGLQQPQAYYIPQPQPQPQQYLPPPPIQQQQIVQTQQRYIPPPAQQQQQHVIQPQQGYVPPPAQKQQQFLQPPPTQQQPQQQQQLVQPQQGYIPPPTQQPQKQSNAMKFPMPADFASMFNFQPAVKTSKRRYRPRTRIPKKPIVTKNFFIHSAPEETEAEIEEELSALQNRPHKHYNVLFVKAPSQTNKVAALNLAKAIKEEKTVVYVLAKKTSASDLQDAIQQSPQQINKPEVFFIKYRTPEEAANAQQQIQSQYDSLGGSSVLSDEGVAPATSVIGSLDSDEEEDEEEQQQSQQQLENLHEQHEQQLVNNLPASSNGYLPPPAHLY